MFERRCTVIIISFLNFHGVHNGLYINLQHVEGGCYLAYMCKYID